MRKARNNGIRSNSPPTRPRGHSRFSEQAQQKIAVRRALFAERDRMIAEITSEARGNPTPAQAFEIETVRDLFQRLMDEA